MKRVLFVLAVTAVFFIGPDVNGATFCRQEFEFLAAGNDMIWIAEDVSGECMSSVLLSLNLRGEGATLGSMYLKEFGKWGPVKDLLPGMYKAMAVELKRDKQGWLRADKLSWQLGEPKKQCCEVIEQFDEHIRKGASGAESWNRKYGKYDLPKVKGAKLILDYYYPKGFYINYSIDKAYFFPREKIVLVFTKNEKLAAGMDTMHGFMILKIAGDGK